ncbi:acetyl xylan esterase [Leptospira inadai serovar Lyme str. 10]|uniref:Acetyl xylan esterase n=2 Tax=Leptospira inadai serovar Lyme TaxID=293084 RepID=V6HDS4_9LEPT|nr:acetylxylan esterase [Leptospira inadai]EQA38092.1 acetyl xylan esterase [Leptospira inadai serovar Lyme str. 10]PNV72801.1 acetylesterase [Leptospira inadai serovar Lyme]
MAISFDECFQTYPSLQPPADLDDFWTDAVRELKGFPVKNQTKALLKGTILKETIYDISFQSYGNATLTGSLVIPRKRGDLPVLAYFHDYAKDRPQIIKGLTEAGVAQLILDLRGHGSQLIRPVLKEGEFPDPDWTPGYFRKGLEVKESFFLKGMYLDVIRTIEFLRLTDGIDGDRIILAGKGIGAALAAFGAANSGRVKGIILETPNFCHVDDAQLRLGTSWTKEIAEQLALSKSKKTVLRKNLAYFDTLNFSKKIKIPTLVSVGMEDQVSHPKSVFALFNHLVCDKRMQVYPTEGNEAGVAGDKQNLANLEFVREILFSE